MNEHMIEWRNKSNDGKYKCTCNNLISDPVFMIMASENDDMTKDMIEEGIQRRIIRIMNKTNKIINQWINQWINKQVKKMIFHCYGANKKYQHFTSV